MNEPSLADKPGPDASRHAGKAFAACSRPATAHFESAMRIARTPSSGNTLAPTPAG
ncbi:conserved protein of unknown function [Ectopseudomonas oleovorans]|uniref:Uncharacterized protein n=1 Tax=Ectopseudomonas oleovorans TaxID=301 RepID=A0A653BBC8_ECTOL|nr:conserved protein of unknown function [Pseudomonas oleovorans]